MRSSVQRAGRTSQAAKIRESVGDLASTGACVFVRRILNLSQFPDVARQPPIVAAFHHQVGDLPRNGSRCRRCPRSNHVATQLPAWPIFAALGAKGLGHFDRMHDLRCVVFALLAGTTFDDEGVEGERHRDQTHATRHRGLPVVDVPSTPRAPQRPTGSARGQAEFLEFRLKSGSHSGTRV